MRSQMVLTFVRGIHLNYLIQVDDIYIDCQPVNSSGQTMVEEPSLHCCMGCIFTRGTLMNFILYLCFWIFLYDIIVSFF